MGIEADNSIVEGHYGVMGWTDQAVDMSGKWCILGP